MKPRLRLLQKIWFCRTPGVTGIGYSPLMAWEDWADLARTLWRKV